jgi:hypothetical protein
MIEHNIAVELLRLAILVYNYGEKFTLKEDETIETFINENTEINGINERPIGVDDILFDVSKNCPSGKVCNFVSDTNTDTQGCVVIDDNNICVVFRGSSSLKDWFYDIQIRKHHLKNNVWIHKGFYKALYLSGVYRTIADEIKNLLKVYPNHKIYVTGHSLGAAIASLFGYLLSEEINNNITVVAFASPRVGNKGWYKSFMEKPNLKQYRINNNKDIVTSFPYYKYYHVGKCIRLYKKKIYLSDIDNNSIFRYWKFSDHLCYSYYKNINLITW